MVRSAITPEEQAEVQRLTAEYKAADKRARAILATKGMDSPEFAKADAATGAVRRRIREILGTSTEPWNA